MVSAQKFAFMHWSVSRYCCGCKLMIFRWVCAVSFSHPFLHSISHSWNPTAKAVAATAAIILIGMIAKKTSKQSNRSTMSCDIWFVAIFHLYVLYCIHIHPIHLLIYYHWFIHQKHTHTTQSWRFNSFFFVRSLRHYIINATEIHLEYIFILVCILNNNYFIWTLSNVCIRVNCVVSI